VIFLVWGQVGQPWGQDLLVASHLLSSTAFQNVKCSVSAEVCVGQYPRSRAAVQAAVPCPTLDGVRLCMGGLGEDFAPFRHHGVCGRETFCTLVRGPILFPLSGRKEMKRQSCSVKAKGIWLRHFVKCMAFGLEEKELLH